MKQVQTSCGFAVPYLTTTPNTPAKLDRRDEVTKAILQDRETLGHWVSKRIEDKTLRQYQVVNNTVSLDGLTGLRVARRDKGERFLMMEVQVTYRRVMAQREPLLWGMVMGMATMFLFMMTTGG